MELELLVASGIVTGMLVALGTLPLRSRLRSQAEELRAQREAINAMMTALRSQSDSQDVTRQRVERLEMVAVRLGNMESWAAPRRPSPGGAAEAQGSTVRQVEV